MRNVMSIDPSWLTEAAPQFYQHQQLNARAHWWLMDSYCLLFINNLQCSTQSNAFTCIIIPRQYRVNQLFWLLRVRQTLLCKICPSSVTHFARERNGALSWFQGVERGNRSVMFCHQCDFKNTCVDHMQTMHSHIYLYMFLSVCIYVHNVYSFFQSILIMLTRTSLLPMDPSNQPTSVWYVGLSLVHIGIEAKGLHWRLVCEGSSLVVSALSYHLNQWNLLIADHFSWCLLLYWLISSVPINFRLRTAKNLTIFLNGFGYVAESRKHFTLQINLPWPFVDLIISTFWLKFFVANQFLIFGSWDRFDQINLNSIFVFM